MIQIIQVLLIVKLHIYGMIKMHLEREQEKYIIISDYLLF